MILLRLISWPYARKHLLRTLLTMAGIVLGVAVFVGMHTANESVLAAFHQTIDRIAGPDAAADFGGRARVFEKTCWKKCRTFREVRAASPVIEATVSTDQGNLLILGVDMLGDRSLRNYDLEGADTALDDPLVFLAQPDSLIVTRSFADQRGLKTNSHIPMKTMDGERVFTVRGIMKPGGLASAFGGNLAIMDIYAAQKIFGRGRQVRPDRYGFAGRRDAGAGNRETAQLPSGRDFRLSRPARAASSSRRLREFTRSRPNITSVFALFIGMFIIYNTFAIAVTQRRAEIGILRALGATRGQIRTLFLTESAITGLVGNAGRSRVRNRDGAGDGGLYRRAAGRSLWSIAERREHRNRAVADPCRGRDGLAHQSDRGSDSGARGGVRGSGKGAAKGQFSIAWRRRKPGAAALGDRLRGVVRDRAGVDSIHAGFLRGIPAGGAGGGIARAGDGARLGARAASRAGQDSTSGRRARRGQLDSRAAAHFGHRSGVDAVAGAGDFARRAGAVELQLAFGLDAHRAESRSVCHHAQKA